MDARDILVEMQRKWNSGNTADTNWNSMILGGISRAVEKICMRRNWWFLWGSSTIATVADQLTYKIGSPPPVTPCTAAAGAAGALTGTYRYMVTYVNAFGESNPSPKSSVITFAATDGSLTAIPTADSSQLVTSRKIYRNKSGDPNVFYLLTTLANNTTTTYTDATADGSLGALMPYQHIIMPIEEGCAYQTDSPATIAMLKMNAFRKLRPDASKNTGEPLFGMTLGDELSLYPLADGAYTVSYYYSYRHKRIVYENDIIPYQIPMTLIIAGTEVEVLPSMNEERQMIGLSAQLFDAGLREFEFEAERHSPPVDIITEDEDVANWVSAVQTQDWYNG